MMDKWGCQSLNNGSRSLTNKGVEIRTWRGKNLKVDVTVRLVVFGIRPDEAVHRICLYPRCCFTAQDLLPQLAANPRRSQRNGKGLRKHTRKLCGDAPSALERTGRNQAVPNFHNRLIQRQNWRGLKHSQQICYDTLSDSTGTPWYLVVKSRE